MVQLWNLPPKVDLASMIGEGLGQGLGTGIQRGSEIGFQRGLLKNAFDESLGLYKNPNATPLERTVGALKAFAAIPGSERYVGQILPMLNQMAAFQQPAQGQAGGAPPSPSIGGEAATIPPATQEQKQRPMMIQGQPVPSPTEAAWPQEDIDLYEPFLGQGVKKYSPQEIQAVEQKDLAGGLPSSPRAEFMRKQNQEIENVVDRISTRQKDFANYYNQTHPNLSPDDVRIAQKFYRSKDALQAPTNEEKTRVVDNFLDRYRNLKTNIANQTPRSLIGKIRSEQESELKNQVDWLLKEGQRDLAKEYLTSTLGFGDSESERIIKEPSRQQVELLSNFEKLPDLNVDVPKFGKTSREFQTYTEQRSKKLNEYEPRVMRAIQPGTAKDPGTSLLVLRDIAMDSTGMTWPEYNTMVNKLYAEGKIKLDPYQLQELPKLTSAPYSGFLDMLIERR